MNEAPWLNTDTAVRRYLVGWTVLLITVLLSNYSGFLDHPERIFDAAPNSPWLERVHVAGVAGQLVALGVGFLSYLIDAALRQHA